ncbi:hypothetical protein RHSIM_Rhsim07G0190800 [Rhododendron simsii]|uniref:Uncharacterized protein n=1 Tax=Rhododendron simsii TaxID=118357 RepID=A0A834LLM9_RHOSS|nr:hypothetical protein RHSIM_Rhsim07G0190800 [Rhododendron simsii]
MTLATTTGDCVVYVFPPSNKLIHGWMIRSAWWHWGKMQTSDIERTNLIRGKQSLEGRGDNDEQLERKRPALEGGGDVTVHVGCLNGSKCSVQIKHESSVGSFKSVLTQNLLSSC